MVYFSSFTDVETRARPEVSAVRVTGLWVFSQKSDAGLGEAGLPWSAPPPPPPPSPRSCLSTLGTFLLSHAPRVRHFNMFLEVVSAVLYEA